MHLITIIIAIAIAWLVRQRKIAGQHTFSQRWYTALFLFLFPSLLLLTTALAILYMGCHGLMLGVQAGSLGCGVAASLILLAIFSLVKLTAQGYSSIKQLDNLAQISIQGKPAKIIELDLLYSAQIGFWNSQLVVSRGLLNTLDTEHLEAVLAHEQAHAYYRDTFWFFWYGWIRSFSFWLPQTEELWHELLLLRELRADRQAALEIDFLLLAESLLTVAQAPLKSNFSLCANFNNSQIGDRLNERIDFLLQTNTPIPKNKWQHWTWLCLLLLPLLTIPLHY
ncbi:peptidase M56 BlaR1 [Chondrocystis sp. NIES-4102]|nr:peptidase M56 BlaR1 [Chondrocystis sp. NIES-4102]